MPSQDKPIPLDAAAWLVLWEASLRDRDNDELAAVAGGYLLEILKDRGIHPCGTRLARRANRGGVVAQGDRFRIVLTITVPYDQPGGPVLALRWIVTRLIDAIASSPFPITVRVEREAPPSGG